MSRCRRRLHLAQFRLEATDRLAGQFQFVLHGRDLGLDARRDLDDVFGRPLDLLVDCAARKLNKEYL